MEDSLPIVIRPVCAESILGLRHQVLLAGLPDEAAHFSGDDELDTWHFGVFLCNEKHRLVPGPIACVSFMRDDEGEPAWRLRGMAVSPNYQGMGFGRKLLAYSEETLQFGLSIRLLWCNARLPAVVFYKRLGWKVTSNEFEIPDAGPHLRMIKRL